MTDTAYGAGQSLRFGRFELQPMARLLRLGDQQVKLSDQALDILAALAERAGIIVAAHELVARIRQPDADAAQLWDSISAVNLAFASHAAQDHYVAHYPDEGFVLMTPPALAPAHAPVRGDAMPSRRTPVIGRADALQRIGAQLAERRFVTIVGAGGMGKTTVALALAQRLSGSYREGICFVDLAPLADPRLVPQALASSLGFAVAAQDPLRSLKAFLRGKQMLIVLDSCEHVIESAASVAETALAGAVGIHVLATSREPLRAMEEWLYRISPMELPPEEGTPGAARVQSYAAIQLLVERASAGNAGFKLQDQQAELAATLCRRLDGIPLAIEIAAARVAQLGIADVVAKTEERLLQLQGGPDTAPVRHRTLAAMLDWSHELLLEREKLTLRRLSVFRGGFTFEAAQAVVADDAISTADVTDAVLDLLDKSLVSRISGTAKLRLLDTTRAYASGKLEAQTERRAVLRRHAQFLLSLLRGAEADWDRLTLQQWLATYSPWIDDIRAALGWALSAAGDESLGIALTYASFPLARQMNLDAEFKVHVERVLSVLTRASLRQHLVEMTLKAYLGSMGHRGESEQLTPLHLLELAIENNDSGVSVRDRIIALGSNTHIALMLSDFATAAAWAASAGEAACDSADAIAITMSERMQAQTQHFMGHHDSARGLAQRVLDNAWRKIPLSYNPSPVEPRVSMRIVLARILWLKGLPDQAKHMAEESVEQAGSATAIARCQALAMGAVPIALWNGHNARCQALVAMLLDQARRYSLGYWETWGIRYQQVLVLRERAEATAVEPDLFNQGPLDANLRDHLCTVDARLLGPDNTERVATGMVGWCAPEVLRAQGEATLRGTAPDPARAEALFRQSLAMAREQQALSWELRAATSLARLLHNSADTHAARDLLAGVYENFTEGFDTMDLVEAGLLLKKLQAGL